MERKCRKSKRGLPLTPRVSGKVMEYYTKFGKERNLEKFMRLYSSATSTSTTSTSHDSPAIKNCKKSRPSHRKNKTKSNDNSVLKLESNYHQKKCKILGSHSMPNIGTLKEEGHCLVKTNTTVPIIISKSNEQVQTSEEHIELKKPISTPESTKKAHKRLEWDSLGDIGYKNSASTLSLTQLERSLLQALFKQTDTNPQPSTSKAAAEVENLLQRSPGTAESIMSPLASSTRLQERPKMISQGTHMTGVQNIENYCQTSFAKLPQVCSKEIQVNLSSSNSLMASVTTPSSFEYKSKGSYCSSNSKDDNFKPKDAGVASSLSAVLMNRRTLSENNLQQSEANTKRFKNVQTKILAAFNDKENKQCSRQSNSSSQLSSPVLSKTDELDLGIQLICSLINAERFSEKQKKHLIRHIVKRILRVGGGEDKQPSPFPQKPKTIGSSSDISDDSVTAIIPIRRRESDSNSVMPGSRQIHNESTSNIPPIRTGMILFSNKPSNTEIEEGNSSDSPTDDSLIEIVVFRRPSLKNPYNDPKKIGSSTSTSTGNIQQKRTDPNVRESAGGFEENNSSSITTTNSNEAVLKGESSKPDAGHFNPDATMEEWLSPITKSEIEYEQKKHSDNQPKKLPQQGSKERDKQRTRRRNCSGENYGRIRQLSWIENEIKRLECLKYLLLRDSTDSFAQSTSSLSGEKSGQSITTKQNYLLPEAVYDSVNTDQSDMSKSDSKISGVKINEIEVIIEESNEDVINLNDNLQRTKERKRETQLIYENPLTNEDLVNNKRPKYRNMRETTTITEEQLLDKIPHKNEQKTQREKIDTPPPMNDDCNNRDSLKHMVKQRKQEFLELYNHKKRQQNYAISKLQRRLLQRAHRDIIINQAQQQHSKDKKFQQSINKEPTNSTEDISAETENPHSSGVDVPQSLSTITSSSTNKTTKTTPSDDVVSSTSTSLNTQSSTTSHTPQQNEIVSLTNDGIAVQTNDSIVRSTPIYGPQLTKNNSKNDGNIPKTYRADRTVSSTAGIQVKPKGIAYVIEFNGGEKSTQLNSREKEDLKTVDSKSDVVPSASTTTYITNSIKKYDKDNTEQQTVTLQEHLEKTKPKFIKRYQQRQEVLQKMREMQQARNRQIRQIVDSASFNSLEKHIKALPPPPTERVRILNTKQMKALTHKRFTKLPEVVAKKEREYEEKRRLNNRKLRDLFNQRLQERVRSGKTSLNHSRTVI